MLYMGVHVTVALVGVATLNLALPAPPPRALTPASYGRLLKQSSLAVNIILKEAIRFGETVTNDGDVTANRLIFSQK